jgi:GNAT superfamily N-acetyltransferase
MVPYEIVRLVRPDGDSDIVRLLALAQIHQPPEETARRSPYIAKEYIDSPALSLYGGMVDGPCVGIVGIEPSGAGSATIRDLAGDPSMRRSGIGRALTEYVRNELGYASLEGDTLSPVVEFYRRCGFLVSENGTMPDGQVRYRFAWRKR